MTQHQTSSQSYKTMFFGMLVLSLICVNTKASDGRLDQQAILEEYAYILDFPVVAEAPTSKWNFRLSTLNVGQEEDDAWHQRITLGNEALSRFIEHLWLAADLVDLQSDYSYYASLGSVLPEEQSTNSGLSSGLSSGHWRWQMSFSNSYYDSGAFDEAYDYDENIWSVSLSISREFFLGANWMVSLGADVRHQPIERHGSILNPLNPNLPWSVTTQQRMLIPSVAVEFSHRSEPWLTFGNLTYASNINELDTSDDQFALIRLGRVDAEFEFQQLEYFLEHSWFYTSNATGYFAGKSTSNAKGKKNWQPAIVISSGGSHSFADRMIPQLQWSIGGMDTVRGFEEGLFPADTGAYIRVEHQWRYWPSANMVWFGPGVQQVFYGFLDAGYAATEDGELSKELQSLSGISENQQDTLESVYDPLNLKGNHQWFSSAGFGFSFSLIYDIEIKAETAWVTRAIDGLVDNGDSEVHAELSWNF